MTVKALNDDGKQVIACVRRGTEGLRIVDDWSGFGQRTTASGTVLLDNVRVPKTHLVPGYKGYEAPSADGALFQIVQVAIDSGIAEAAINETIRLVREKSRPSVDSGLDRASDDTYPLQRVGDPTLRLAPETRAWARQPAAQLAAHGVRPVPGDLIAADTRFSGPPHGAGCEAEAPQPCFRPPP